MKIREVNFNATALRGKAEPPMATYISPPRPNKQKLLPQPQLQRQSCVAPTSSPSQSYYAEAETEVYASSLLSSYAAATDPTRMMDLDEGSYAQCPCATCAQYRAYYAMKMSESSELRPETLHAAPATCIPTIYDQQQSLPQTQQQQQQPSMMTTMQRQDVPPVLTIGVQRPKVQVASHASVFNQPPPPPPPQLQLPQQQQHAKLCVTPTVSASMAHDTLLPLDTAEEFERKCVGRVVELACTAEGRSMLLAAVRSQDAMVIDTMVNEIVADVETVALDNHGCHILRVLKDYMNAEQTALLVSSFSETLVLNLCTVSQYTRRILQSLFEHPLIDLQPIVNVLASNVQYLAATQQGCISLMRVFELCSAEQKMQLMAPLVPLFTHIALDPFGNYVVQCAIEHSGKTVAAQYTMSCFAGKLLNMSCNKYASNAVEKIIKVCGDVPAVRRLLMDELIFNPAALLQMVQDSFGNFVVQSIIEHTQNPTELKRICDRLRPALLSSPYASKIEAKIRTKVSTVQLQQQPHRHQAPRQGQTRRSHQQQR
ncbi:pumilio protein 9 [Trypanosoma rangeli]|uniref:Pumilio protein 9 n=1 Tax=Trypanosoma rangeli TaxID=5698 RepID=A0A3R7NFN9_TRYRA|nr:pumilio protein 9 [Trypanosoma rangeli]RNF02025.1 pumilio protein 9 [Trypanosoma rangeli]|eukprot:RNF02025.1 pumilio protein 9 [Trypanosoma rangeli]